MFILVLAAVAVVGAAEPDACPGGVVALNWAAMPTEEQIWWSYPPAAMATRASGMVTLRCGVTPAGATENCRVIEETPAGLGFGAAALTLSTQFVFRPKVACGQAVEGDVSIPIRFQPPPDLVPPDGPGPSPRALALGRRLLTAMHGEAALDAWVTAMTDASLRQVGFNDAVRRKAMFEAMSGSFSAHRPEMLQAMVVAYAGKFSEPELARAAAFFESPLGQKLSADDTRLQAVVAGATESVRVQVQWEAKADFCAKVQTCGDAPPPTPQAPSPGP